MGGRGSAGGNNVGKSLNTPSRGEMLEAAEHYLGPEGFEMNALARGLSVKDEPDGEWTVQDLKKWDKDFSTLLEQQSLKSAKTVFRGTGFDNLSQQTGLSKDQILSNPKSIVGKQILEKGYMSTANNYADAKGYAKGVVWKIALPKGAKAVRQADITPMGDYEYTVQKNAEVKITRAQVSNGTLIIYAKYVRAGKK